VYNSESKEILLYGGRDLAGLSTQLYALSVKNAPQYRCVESPCSAPGFVHGCHERCGRRWAPISTTGELPPPMDGFSIDIYNTATGPRLILFGGKLPDGTYSNSMCGSIHNVGQRLPPACLGLAAHPSHRAQGFACSYELDYTALRWTQKVVAGSLPDGRASHAAAIFAPGGQASGLVVWGGSNAQLLQDLWLFEFTSGTWLQLPCARRRQHGPMPPPARAAAAF
jgi:hypothetical protein